MNRGGLIGIACEREPKIHIIRPVKIYGFHLDLVVLPFSDPHSISSITQSVMHWRRPRTSAAPRASSTAACACSARMRSRASAAGRQTNTSPGLARRCPRRILSGVAKLLLLQVPARLLEVRGANQFLWQRRERVPVLWVSL